MSATTDNVIDLAAAREKRTEAKQIEALIRECNVLLLRHCPEKARRVISMRLVELSNSHGVQLAKLAPVLREILVLRTAGALVGQASVPTQDAAFMLACAAASLTDDTDLANEMPARIAALREALPDEMRRMEREYGKELLADPQPPPAPSNET